MTPLLIFLVVIFLVFSIRLLRFLAILQQKEYRIDRIILFLKSESGQQELLRLIKKRDLTRYGLKRPKFSWRISIISFISFLLVSVFVLLVITLKQSWLVRLALLLVLYWILPFFTLFANFTIIPLSRLLNIIFANLARLKLKKHKPLIIGITGSYGKTSTKQLLAHLLNYKFSVSQTPKSYNTKFSISKFVLRNYTQQKYLILEYAAYKQGEIRDLCKYFPPDYAILTGFTNQHLGLFGSLEKIVEAKTELVRALDEKGVLFFNGKDEKAREIGKKFPGKAIDYSKSDFSSVKIGELGELQFTWKGRRISSKIIGRHYLANIKAAIAAAQHLGIGEDIIVKAIREFKPSEQFVKTYLNNRGALVIDDSGTSNPKGFLASLELARELSKKQNILIFGGIVDLGDSEDYIHQQLARKARVVFSKVFYTGIDGRSSFIKVFGRDLVFDEQKIRKAISNADKNYMILIEGRITQHIYNLVNSRTI